MVPPDDTAAVQAAIAAGLPVSGTILLPAGTYGISAELRACSASTSADEHRRHRTRVLGRRGAVLGGKSLSGWCPGGAGCRWTDAFSVVPASVKAGSSTGNLIAAEGVTVGSTPLGYGVWQAVPCV